LNENERFAAEGGCVPAVEVFLVICVEWKVEIPDIGIVLGICLILIRTALLSSLRFGSRIRFRRALSKIGSETERQAIFPRPIIADE